MVALIFGVICLWAWLFFIYVLVQFYRETEHLRTARKRPCETEDYRR
jgi:hypothetical protein